MNFMRIFNLFQVMSMFFLNIQLKNVAYSLSLMWFFLFFAFYSCFVLFWMIIVAQNYHDFSEAIVKYYKSCSDHSIGGEGRWAQDWKRKIQQQNLGEVLIISTHIQLWIHLRFLRLRITNLKSNFHLLFCFWLHDLFRYNTKKIELHTGQKHHKVNHSKEYKTKDGIHTNVIEGNNLALKSKFVIFCFVLF